MNSLKKRLKTSAAGKEIVLLFPCILLHCQDLAPSQRRQFTQRFGRVVPVAASLSCWPQAEMSSRPLEPQKALYNFILHVQLYASTPANGLWCVKLVQFPFKNDMKKKNPHTGKSGTFKNVWYYGFDKLEFLASTGAAMFWWADSRSACTRHKHVGNTIKILTIPLISSW